MEKAQNEEKNQPKNIPELDFLGYITSLAFQAMVFLGEVPSPVTNKVEINILQAKFLIDTLSLIREKTKGNLSEQEDAMVNTAIYELQIKYVQATKKEGSS